MNLSKLQETVKDGKNCSPWGHKELDLIEWLNNDKCCIFTYTSSFNSSVYFYFSLFLSILTASAFSLTYLVWQTLEQHRFELCGSSYRWNFFQHVCYYIYNLRLVEFTNVELQIQSANFWTSLGTVVMNLSTKIEDMSLIPGPGRFQKSWSYYAHEPQLLSHQSGACELQVLSLCATITKAHTL